MTVTLPAGFRDRSDSSIGGLSSVKLEVEHVRGMRACRPGARGSALLVDDQRFDANGLRRDTVVTKFGVNCRLASGRWSNLGGAARATVAATAR
jgi:hypothetical protein